jgi:serine/threonine protein kinase
LPASVIPTHLEPSIATSSPKPSSFLAKASSSYATSGWRSRTVPLEPSPRVILTLWYKAPEFILSGLSEFSIKKWSFDCFVYELITFSPPFPGDEQVDQILRILAVFGTPSEE